MADDLGSDWWKDGSDNSEGDTKGDQENEETDPGSK